MSDHISSDIYLTNGHKTQFKKNKTYTSSNNHKCNAWRQRKERSKFYAIN